MGVITMKVTEKTGSVVGALKVNEEDDIMLMTAAGQRVRIPAASARLTGRNAQGVKLMNLKEGETIQDIARVVKDDSEVEGDGDGDAGEAGAEGSDASAAAPEAPETEADDTAPDSES